MVLTDSGFFFALANSKDQEHTKAVEMYHKYSKSLSTTWPVITETCHLLLARIGPQAQERFINGLNKVTIFELDHSKLIRIETLMKKYRDLPMDLADASLVIMAEETNVGNILSVDYRDFGIYRWKSQKPFNNLMLES